MSRNIETIALDLEGTLISNAISQIPRPHLHRFLEGCKEITKRVVIFTTVREKLLREIAQLLVYEGHAPEWFASIEYIEWTGNKKDLNFIPNSNVESTILIDDVEAYVVDGQKQHWFEIQQFTTPYSDGDNSLLLVLEHLRSYTSKDQY